MVSSKQRVLMVAPSLDLKKNVSGVSAVTQFIISHNKECEYEHFLQGKSDGENGTLKRVLRIWRNYKAWVNMSDDENGGDDARIIHYNFPLDAASVVRDYFFMRAAQRQGRRMVIHVHGGLYLFQERKPYIIRRFLNQIFSWNCPFIVLSNKEKEQIQRVYPAKNVFVLPNCVDLPMSNDNVDVNEDGNWLHVLYIGRIEKNKGMDYLYEAMKALKEQNIMLHFAGIEQGANGYVEKFRELLGDRFSYEGIVAGEEKKALFRRCQVFVLPSLYEGLPMSLLECMSFGLVPVTTDVGSIGEYVENGTNGLLLKVKDSNAIVEALTLLLHDSALVQRLSKAARHTISSQFNSMEYIEKLNAIYAQAV